MKIKKINLFLLFGCLITQTAETMAADEQLCVEISSSVHQSKTITVKGRVMDTTGNPIIGATILQVDNKGNGTLSDIDGNFLITVPSGSVIHISYIGYIPQDVKAVSDQNLVITLNENSLLLDEVVSIGYSSMKRKDLTGSVASISSEKIARIPATDIAASLVGVPGIGFSDGAIRIRGTRSTNANNDPLIVLDGIPYSGALHTINPEDVASIDILKDASSTAIYGAKGANGVILITTKKADKGKTIVSYDGLAGFATNNQGSFEMMNADEYIAYKREANRAIGNWNSEADDVKIFPGVELGNLGKMDTDWMSPYFDKKRFWTSHVVTIASANDKTQYKVSFKYVNNKPREKNSGSDYFYLVTDLSHQVLPFLKVGVSNRDYYQNSRTKPDQFASLMRMSPLTPIYNEDGTLNENPFGDTFLRNPYLNDNDRHYKNQSESWNIFLRIFAELNLGKNLTYTTNFSYNPKFSTGGYYYDGQSAASNEERNTASMSNSRTASWVWNNVLNYKLSYKKHTLNAVGVFEMQNAQSVSASMSGKDQNSPTYLWYNMGQLLDSKSISSKFVRTQMVSSIARLQYDYAGRYILSGSLRADGASQLSEGHKWAVFPAGAIAWRLSEENFLKSVKWLSNLKLNVSYGITGNYSIAAYATRGALYGTYVTFKDQNGENHKLGMEPWMRPTPDLEWEKNKMLNIGLDFGFLNNRISGRLEWYDSKSFDLLYQKVLPYSTGYNRAWCNIGDTRNRGVEASLTVVPIQKKDMDLSLSFTYYKNKEELVRLQDSETKEDLNNFLFVGYPVRGVFYDYKQVGIWQKDEAEVAAIYGQVPGSVKVADLDGNQKIDANDRMIIGTNRPDWVGSFSVTGRWKNIDVTMDFYGEFGALTSDSFLTTIWGVMPGRFNVHKVDYWTPENPSNRYPRPLAGMDIKYLSACSYYKNDYIMARNMTVGYTIPASIMNKNNILKYCRVYLTTNTPFMYSRKQKDGAVNYWEALYVMGVNLKF